MTFQGDLKIYDADALRVQELIDGSIDDYFTEVVVSQEGYNVIVEVYSEDDTALQQTYNFLVDEGYDLL